VAINEMFWERPVLRAIELYRGEMVQKILFTGGFNERVSTTTAEIGFGRRVAARTFVPKQRS
jgi:hypothetical protein